MKTHWHDVNPWRDSIVYVPLAELAECLADGSNVLVMATGQIEQNTAERQLKNWQSRSEIYGTPGQLDAYILPQPSGEHSAGVRYGAEGSQYCSPYVPDQTKLAALLAKYKQENR